MADGPLENKKTNRFPRPALVQVQHHGGDIFSSVQLPSDFSVLWGECIKEKERRFLRAALETEFISFAITDSYQISAKIAWTPEAKAERERWAGAQRPRVESDLVMLLHGKKGRLTSSWAWCKLALPLWKQGLSVIMLDFPGYGRSAVNMRYMLDSKTWQNEDWHIIVQYLSLLGSTRPVRFVACDEACATVVKLLQHSPHIVHKQHFFLDPVISLDERFPRDALPGAGIDWRSAVKELQYKEFEKLLAKNGNGLWVCFTEGRTDTDEAREALLHLQKRRTERGGTPIVVTNISKEHVVACQAGAKLNVAILCICKYLRACIASYVAGKLVYPPAVIPLEATDCSNSTSLPSMFRSDSFEEPFSDSVMEETLRNRSKSSGLSPMSTQQDWGNDSVTGSESPASFRHLSNPVSFRAGTDQFMATQLGALQVIYSRPETQEGVRPQSTTADRVSIIRALQCQGSQSLPSLTRPTAPLPILAETSSSAGFRTTFNTTVRTVDAFAERASSAGLSQAQSPKTDWAGTVDGETRRKLATDVLKSGSTLGGILRGSVNKIQASIRAVRMFQLNDSHQARTELLVKSPQLKRTLTLAKELERLDDVRLEKERAAFEKAGGVKTVQRDVSPEPSMSQSSRQPSLSRANTIAHSGSPPDSKPESRKATLSRANSVSFAVERQTKGPGLSN